MEMHRRMSSQNGWVGLLHLQEVDGCSLGVAATRKGFAAVRRLQSIVLGSKTVWLQGGTSEPGPLHLVPSFLVRRANRPQEFQLDPGLRSNEQLRYVLAEGRVLEERPEIEPGKELGRKSLRWENA